MLHLERSSLSVFLLRRPELEKGEVPAALQAADETLLPRYSLEMAEAPALPAAVDEEEDEVEAAAGRQQHKRKAQSPPPVTAEKKRREELLSPERPPSSAPVGSAQTAPPIPLSVRAATDASLSASAAADEEVEALPHTELTYDETTPV
jgi:hypothetical protein